MSVMMLLAGTAKAIIHLSLWVSVLSSCLDPSGLAVVGSPDFLTFSLETEENAIDHLDGLGEVDSIVFHIVGPIQMGEVFSLPLHRSPGCQRGSYTNNLAG